MMHFQAKIKGGLSKSPSGRSLRRDGLLNPGSFLKIPSTQTALVGRKPRHNLDPSFTVTDKRHKVGKPGQDMHGTSSTFVEEMTNNGTYTKPQVVPAIEQAATNELRQTSKNGNKSGMIITPNDDEEVDLFWQHKKNVELKRPAPGADLKHIAGGNL